jgi:hypothetical protein
MAHEPAEAGGAGVTEGVQLKQAAVAGGYVLLILADGALKLLAQEPEEEGESHFLCAIGASLHLYNCCYCVNSCSWCIVAVVLYCSVVVSAGTM